MAMPPSRPNKTEESQPAQGVTETLRPGLNKTKGLQLVGLAIAALVAVLLINFLGITQLRSVVDDLGPWVPAGLFVLRFTSVLIPALPGTAYSLLAGTLLGFWKALAVVCLSDLLSCLLCFWLARRWGRSLVTYFVGARFMDRVERLSQKHVERNFFLMTACLMTGFFDFVAYAMGLAKAPWRRFIPALVCSIALSNPPVVALGAGIFDQGRWLLVGALLGVFGLAIVTGVVQRRIASR